MIEAIEILDAEIVSGDVPMTAEEARHCAGEIRRHLSGARALIVALHRREGWRALGYASWRECVTAEFEQSQTHLYRQLQAGIIEERISPIGEIGAIPEGQLRPLNRLEPELQPEAWERAHATAPNGQVTGAHVAEVVREMLAPEPEPALDLPPIPIGTTVWWREEDGWIRTGTVEREWAGQYVVQSTTRGFDAVLPRDRLTEGDPPSEQSNSGQMAPAAPPPARLSPPASPPLTDAEREAREAELRRETEMQDCYERACEVLWDEAQAALETGAPTPLLDHVLAAAEMQTDDWAALSAIAGPGMRHRLKFLGPDRTDRYAADKLAGIRAWLRAVRDGKALVSWEQACEFQIELPDGQPCSVLYNGPDDLDTSLPLAHLEFFGSLSPTGYRSHFAHYPPTTRSLADFAACEAARIWHEERPKGRRRKGEPPPVGRRLTDEEAFQRPCDCCKAPIGAECSAQKGGSGRRFHAVRYEWQRNLPRSAEVS